MTFISTGLPRSKRLLPLESTEVLRSTDSFLLHVLSDHGGGESNASDVQSDSRRLHEHVSLYWDQQHAYRSYQHHLLREVGSTRGPVRFAGFPQVRIGSRGTEGPSTFARAPTPSRPECRAKSSSETADATYPPQSGVAAASTATASSSSPQTLEETLPPPRSLAAWNWISLVAPYERLLCPSLLYSALLAPSVGGCTSLIYGTQPPSPAPASAAVPEAGGRVCARWSTYTCQTLWALHSLAAEASLPVQEVYIMCAGTIMYLDVILTSGRVWCELQELWGNNLALELDSAQNAMPAENIDGSDTENCSQLSELKSLLSQPAQTYTALLQHARVLLEALTRTTTSTSMSRNTSAGCDAGSTAFPRPLAPWLAAAMEKEEWTPAVVTCAVGDSSSSSDRCEPGSVAIKVLRHAVAQWLSRRGATVTAVTPTGIRAAPLPPRDLCVSRGSHPTASVSTDDCTRVDYYSMRVGSPVPCSGTRRNTIPTARVAGSVTLTTSSTFEAFEPHDLPREQHRFFLPPLPQDPALVAFAAVWRRTLQRCLQEPDVLRQSLRQVILGSAGQRCEELLQQSKQHLLDSHHSVESSAVAESHDKLPHPKTFADVSSPNEKKNTTDNSTRAAASLVLANSSSAARQGSPLVLLTSDPAATSFRVLGPRLGEWLASTRSGGGGWCGFRGELFHCVGPPPPPLVLSPLTGSDYAAQPRRRPPASSRGRSSALVPTPSTEQLIEMFVDGALEVGSASHASPASSTDTPSHATPPLYTVEELADRLCRLGSALPRYATEVSGHCLRPVDADYVREVMQRHCLPLLLACQRRGIQEWRLRGWMKGITLTLLDNSGVESRVITPAKLVELGLQHIRSTDGSNTFATATTLRMVVGGPLSGTLAFLEHVEKRSERTVRWLCVRRLESGGVGLHSSGVPPAVVPRKISTTTLEAVLLRRAEESTLFSIFQSHPSALALAGCGVQRLALLPTSIPPERRHSGGGSQLRSPASTKLLLVRTCGIAVDWDLQECYEPTKFLRLRKPRSLVFHPPRESAAGAGVPYLPLPPELGTTLERVTLRHIRGMLQYYLRSLDTTATTCSATGGTAGDASTTGVVKREREETESPEESLSSTQQPLPNATKSTKTMEAFSRTDTAEASAVDVPRTTLFSIDRAAVLYVLRHHPQYYQHVKGCGIKEVYVAARVSHAGTASDRNDSAVDDASTTPSLISSGEAGRRRATVIIERVCGQLVEVDVEACYNKACEGVPLRPFMMLA